MAGLVGNEVLFVQGVTPNGSLSSFAEQTTTGAIAELASEGSENIIETSFTTTANTTLSGAALVGGQIARSGPTSAFTDTTDTASGIVSALPGFNSGNVFFIRYKNATAFTATLAAGSNVTLPPNRYVPGKSVANYFATLSGTSGSPAVVLTHMSTVPIVVATTALVSANTSIVSTTTLAAVGGLAVPLLTSGTYTIEAELPVTTTGTGGLQLALASSGAVLTATSVNYTGVFLQTGTAASVNTTTLGGGVGTALNVILAELSGTIVVNTGGTIVVQAAQQVSTTATTTLLAGGFLRVTYAG